MARKYFLISVLVSVSGMLSVSACGKKSSDTSEAPVVAPTTPTTPAVNSAGVQLNVVTAGTLQLDGLALTDAPIVGGQANAAQLLSLKYLITNISICQEVTLTGSAYDNPTNCVELYGNNKYSSIYDKFDRAEAEKPEYDEDYIDLMKGLQATASFTAKDVGSYKYALVNWMKPIKVTAQTKLNDFEQTILYTHKGTYGSYQDHNGIEHIETYVKSMTTGPAEEAIAMLDNGGSVFAFGTPFVITEADIENKTNYIMDMVFNPDGLITAGGSSQASASTGHSLIDVTSTVNPQTAQTGKYMDIPFISLVPLVHKSTDKITKETYMIHFNTGLLGTTTDSAVNLAPLPEAGQFDIRAEMYYVTPADAAFSETTPIYGASVLSMFRDESVSVPNQGGFPTIGSVFSMVQDATTKKFSFYGWQGATETGSIISGLSRLETIGGTGTISTHCGPEAAFQVPYVGCYKSSSNDYHRIDFTVPYTLVARADLKDLSGAKVSALEEARLDQAAQKDLALASTQWISPCHVDSHGKYHVGVVNFTADSLYQYRDDVYSDSACSTEYSTNWFVARPTLGAAVGDAEANKLSMKVIAMTSTPLTDQAATDFDTASLCGKTGWAKDSGFDTYAATCNGVTNPDRGDVRYYVLKKTDDGLVLWGDATATETGLTPAARIVSLNTDIVYAMQ